MYGRRHHHDCGPGAAGIMFLVLVFVALWIVLIIAVLRIIGYTYKAIKR